MSKVTAGALDVSRSFYSTKLNKKWIIMNKKINVHYKKGILKNNKASDDIRDTPIVNVDFLENIGKLSKPLS